MALLKGKHSLLRYLGFIGAIFASLQALVWIGMYISGIVCFYINCGVRQPGNKFGKAFNSIYLSTKLSKHYPHIISPIFFHILLWFFVILSAFWLFASVSLIVDYRKWANAKRLRKSSKRWIVVTIIVCVLDLLLFVLFVVDFSMLKTGNIGVSVRSMNEEDYDDGDIDMSPHDPFDPFGEYYDGERKPPANATIPSVTALPEEPGVTSEGPSTPALSFNERLHQIETNLAVKNADVEKRIENLLAMAKLIQETELGTHYNPYVRVKAVKLMEELANLEKLLGEGDKTEDERNKQRILAEKKRIQEQMATSTTEAEGNKTEAKEDTTDKANVTVTDEDYASDDAYQSDQAHPPTILEDDLEEKLDSSENARRNFERIWKKIKEAMKYSEDAEKNNDTVTDTGDARNETENFGELRANSADASDEYKELWQSTFQDDDYGIILQNDGPGTGWRKISAMNEGSATGTDVMLAPSAVLMTLAIRGYLLWIMNLTSALMLLYLYITRPRRPTLITRVQA